MFKLKRKQKLILFMVIYAILCVFVLLAAKHLLFDSEKELVNQAGKSGNGNNRESITESSFADDSNKVREQATPFPLENMEIEAIEDKPVGTIEIKKDPSNELEKNKVEPDSTVNQKTFKKDNSSDRESSIENRELRFDNLFEVNNSTTSGARQGTHHPVEENVNLPDGEKSEEYNPKENGTRDTETKLERKESEKNGHNSFKNENSKKQADAAKDNTDKTEAIEDNKNTLDHIPERNDEEKEQESQIESGIELPLVIVQ